jgi:hypothetical protein
MPHDYASASVSRTVGLHSFGGRVLMVAIDSTCVLRPGRVLSSVLACFSCSWLCSCSRPALVLLSSPSFLHAMLSSLRPCVLASCFLASLSPF